VNIAGNGRIAVYGMVSAYRAVARRRQRRVRKASVRRSVAPWWNASVNQAVSANERWVCHCCALRRFSASLFLRFAQNDRLRGKTPYR